MKRKMICFILYIIIFFIIYQIPTYASDLVSVENSYDMDSLKEGLDKLFPEYQFDLDGLLALIMKGDIWGAVKGLVNQVISGIGSEIGGMKSLLVSILVLGLLSALFSNFSDVFSGQQISQVGFYFIYLFLMAVLTRVFLSAAAITAECLENIVLFVKLFIPTYFMAVGAAVGITTATAGYQFVLVITYGVEKFLLSALIPFIYSYVVLALINGIWTEERLTLMLDLMKKGIAFALKIALGAVTGVSIVQSIITPVIDGIKTSAVKKVVAAIPGIGNLADGVAEMVIGSAVLIKNSIGILLLLLLIFVCAVPLIKLLVIAGMLKLSAALVGVISDKRITNCTDRVGDGSFLLLRTAFTGVALFFILIAITAYTIH